MRVYYMKSSEITLNMSVIIILLQFFKNPIKTLQNEAKLKSCTSPNKIISALRLPSKSEALRGGQGY